MVKIGVVLRYSKLEKGREILYFSERLRRTIQKAGAFVIPIVPVQDVNYNETRYNEFDDLIESEKKIIDDYLNMVDGVVFPGGHKTTPYDKYVLQRCIELDKKVLGICLGMQIISFHDKDFRVYENNTNINHVQEDDNILTHKVKINRNSLLYKIIGSEEIMVNSFHQYHVENNSNDLLINAISEDGFIEGVELPNKSFVMGLQWHPEISYDFDVNSRRIIDYFIKICK